MPILTAKRAVSLAENWKGRAAALERKWAEDKTDLLAELQAADGTIKHLQTLLDEEKKHAITLDHQNQMLQNKIEAQDVSIAGTAAAVAYYEARLQALARIEAMKGQPPSNEPIEFNT